MDFTALLGLMVQKNSFDLFITAGRAPTMKIDGVLVEVSKTPLNKDQTNALVLSLMEPRHKEEFHRTKECQFAVGVPKVGRFRVSAFIQRDAAGMVLHRIRHEIPSLDSLQLPEILKQLAMKKSGLVLFAGALGSGKSTSLNAMIQYRNEHSNEHIVVIDDPMEFMHSHAKSIVTQREVGIDTDSYEVALKNAAQQSPNVVALGEIRTVETMQSAISIVDAGRLLLSTINGNNAEQVIERILNLYPENMSRRVRLDLSNSLAAIVSQQILRLPNGKVHVVAEILINTPAVQETIRKGEFHRFKELIATGQSAGMQSFDQGRCDLFLQQKISYEDALESAEYKNEFRLMVKQVMEKLALENVVENTVIKTQTATKNENVTKTESEKSLSLFEDSAMTLSDVHDDNSDAGSIFTHR
jgi:twitching motility protein PilU